MVEHIVEVAENESRKYAKNSKELGKNECKDRIQELYNNNACKKLATNKARKYARKVARNQEKVHQRSIKELGKRASKKVDKT